MRALTRTALVVAVVATISCHGSDSVPEESDRETRDDSRVPFALDHNQIVFEIEIKGRKVPVLLDTGGNPSVFDLGTVVDLGFEVDTSRYGEASGSGTDVIRVYALPDVGVVVGGQEAEVQSVAMDLGQISTRLERPLGGILGYSFLKERAVRIDFPGRTITLLPADWRQEPTGEGLDLPLNLKGSDPVVEHLEVNGKPITVTLDTGSSLVLEVYGSRQSASTLGLQVLDSTSVIGARGGSVRYTASADSVRLGPYLLENQDVTVDETATDSAVHGNLGNGFLKHFVLTLDYVNEVLRLER